VSGVRPPLLGGRPGIPVEWQRSTMAHLRAVYPFHADAGFGERGVLIGPNVTGGFSGFFFDPFEFYAQGHLSNPNMLVLGSVGFGKSATVKALIRRMQAVYGRDRYLAIIDPKGEYGAVAGDLGLAVIRLRPGGHDRINPMDPGGGDTDGSVLARQVLAARLVAGVLDRELSPLEDAVLGWAVERCCRAGRPFTMRDLSAEILDPPEDLVRISRHSPLELARATAPVTFALDKLCSRTLRGMFDGPTTVHVDWDGGPGVVLDLSAVYSNSAALPLVMVAATHWLASALREHPERRSIQLIDEAWAAVRHGAAYFQSSLKLSRTYGVATVMVCHRPSDLTAQADDGTAAAKIAAGLLSDIQTRVMLRQPPEQVAAAAEMFDLTEREQQWLGQLVQGRAIWRIGTRSAVVQTVLTAHERSLFDTDQRIRSPIERVEARSGCGNS
jgi:type IV secretory pathway VirB4 component